MLTKVPLVMVDASQAPDGSPGVLYYSGVSAGNSISTIPIANLLSGYLTVATGDGRYVLKSSIHVSGAGPSGGSPGDFWFQV
jgi:hypothetical protein